MSGKMVLLENVAGEGQAEMLRGLLEAQGIPVILSQEGAGRAYALTVGPLGAVQLLVPEGNLEQARQVLDAYYAGEFEAASDSQESEQREDEE